MPNYAVILSDEGDSREVHLDLIKKLLSKGITPLTVQRNFWKEYFLRERSRLGIFLFLENIYIRFDEKEREILEFHKSNSALPMVFSKDKKILSINSSEVLEVLDDSRFKYNGMPFVCNVVTTRHYSVKPPRIFVFANRRKAYLELTLNGLFNSLSNLQKLPITIVLSEPTAEVREYALTINKDNVDIIELEKNAYLGVVNYALQYYLIKGVEIDSFIIFEDDFILPGCTSKLYPDWAMLFAERLNTFDIVCWRPSLENLPDAYTHYIFRDNTTFSSTDKMKEPALISQSQRWLSSWNTKVFTGGYGNCVKLDFYLKTAHYKGGVPKDVDFEDLARAKCSPTLAGYHIGWNQEQDGYAALQSKRWEPAPEVNTITDLKTGEGQSYNIRWLLTQ